MAQVRAYIGLGSNLGHPEEQLRQALAAIAGIAQTKLARVSSYYTSAPVGYMGQPDFVNSVAEIETGLAPVDLMTALAAIETGFGRERSFANAPRTLDLDLLLYGDAVIDQPGLQVPHPRMHERRFVLEPMAEIAPDCFIPGHGRIAGLLDACADQPVRRIEER